MTDNKNLDEAISLGTWLVDNKKRCLNDAIDVCHKKYAIPKAQLNKSIRGSLPSDFFTNKKKYPHGKVKRPNDKEYLSKEAISYAVWLVKNGWALKKAVRQSAKKFGLVQIGVEDGVRKHFPPDAFINRSRYQEQLPNNTKAKASENPKPAKPNNITYIQEHISAKQHMKSMKLGPHQW